MRDVDIEFGLIGENQRHMDPVAQDARQHRGGDRAMRMDQVKMLFLQPLHDLRRKRIAGAVADQLCKVDAGVADDLKGKNGIVGVGIIRRDHRRRAIILFDHPRVICHGVRHAVDDRREGIVCQAYVSFSHEKHLLVLLLKYHMDEGLASVEITVARTRIFAII